MIHLEVFMHNTVQSDISALKRYSFLLFQLISRDFKVKYKRSALGVAWSRCIRC